MTETIDLSTLKFHPLTPDHWADFETLFGANGACSGCWCMFWRLPRNQFAKDTYEPNKQAMKHIVESGQVPGLLAYAGAKPIAWVSVGKREDFPSLQRSKVLAPVDDKPVWAIVCYYIPRVMRKQGLMLPLTLAAVDFAKSKGAGIVEAYPMVHEKKLPSASGYMGISPVLKRAGFVEVLRRSDYHPIMRKIL